jgi:hypothetical protein
MTAEHLGLLLEELQQQLSPDEFARVAGAKEDAGLEPEERVQLRVERSRPTLDSLKRWLIPIVVTEPPSGDITRASAYCLNQWNALTRFLDDGRLSLDNNLPEQQLRDIALGRKNFLFAGSQEAAHRTATLYSLMRTCAQHGIEPLPWLTSVLRRLAKSWDPNRLDELLPDRWQLLHRGGDANASPHAADSRTPVMADGVKAQGNSVSSSSSPPAIQSWLLWTQTFTDAQRSQCARWRT